MNLRLKNQGGIKRKIVNGRTFIQCTLPIAVLVSASFYLMSCAASARPVDNRDHDVNDNETLFGGPKISEKTNFIFVG
jgi:hypothetical protein